MTKKSSVPLPSPLLNVSSNLSHIKHKIYDNLLNKTAILSDILFGTVSQEDKTIFHPNHFKMHDKLFDSSFRRACRRVSVCVCLPVVVYIFYANYRANMCTINGKTRNYVCIVHTTHSIQPHFYVFLLLFIRLTSMVLATKKCDLRSQTNCGQITVVCRQER